MRVFVYEHICALGIGREPGSPEYSLFTEGRAMLLAITADFSAVPGVEVVTFPNDVPPNDRSATFSRLAASADWSLVIAPETGGELERLARMVLAAGGKLLGPSPDAIAIASDKIRLGNLWEEWGVPTPRTFRADEAITFPVVCKPRDGCGSEETYLVRSVDELVALPPDPNRLVQEYAEGQPASVAFLVGPRQTIPLLPALQHLSSDGRFHYRGGELPIPPDLAARAVAVGRRAVEAVAGLGGYVGVDVILGERDVTIEINPRLTTSYVGLRAAAETNLAGAMLDVCAGREVEVRWRTGAVQWRADGSVEWPTLGESQPR